jgi:hypothetical protein
MEAPKSWSQFSPPFAQPLCSDMSDFSNILLERVSQVPGYPYPRNFSSPHLCTKGFSLSFS